MKRYLCFFIFLLYPGLYQQAYAQKNDNKSLLWRVSGKHMNQPSYLFGTMHLICPQDYVWTDKMNASLTQTKSVCFEMDISNTQVMMQASMGMMSSKNLGTYFKSGQYAKLMRFVADSLGIDTSVLGNLKPAAVLMLLTTKQVYCDSPVSYEERIMAIAKDDKLAITGIEEPSEQIALLDDMPVDSVINQIMDAVNNKGEDGTDDYHKIVEAYKKQDLPALYKYIINSKKLDADLHAFLDTRNKKWIERMVDKMDNGPVFFAVGAGHLWGDNGIITLLRKQGYTVEQVK